MFWNSPSILGEEIDTDALFKTEYLQLYILNFLTSYEYALTIAPCKNKILVQGL